MKIEIRRDNPKMIIIPSGLLVPLLIPNITATANGINHDNTWPTHSQLLFIKDVSALSAKDDSYMHMVWMLVTLTLSSAGRANNFLQTLNF